MNTVTIKFKSKRNECKAFEFVSMSISDNDAENNCPSFFGHVEPKRDSEGKREFMYEFDINDETYFINEVKKTEIGNDIIDIKVEYNVNSKSIEEMVDMVFNYN